MIKSFNNRAKGASLVEIGLVLGLVSVLLIGSLTSVGQQLKMLFGMTQNTLTNAAAGLPIAAAGSGNTTDPNADPTYGSCKEWSDAADANFTNNGVNEIYPNGASTPINVYCQGAMTLILAQYEADPVTNWNEGIQTDYDPTLASKKGFALSTSEIPSHSKIYFGQDLATPAYCLTATYSTGTLPAWEGATAITYADCAASGRKYFMARSPTLYYSAHNPDRPEGTSYNTWGDTLTLELHETAAATNFESSRNWAFSPNHNIPGNRGYSYLGNGLSPAGNLEAWTVWVE